MYGFLLDSANLGPWLDSANLESFLLDSANLESFLLDSANLDSLIELAAIGFLDGPGGGIRTRAEICFCAYTRTRQEHQMLYSALFLTEVRLGSVISLLT